MSTVVTILNVLEIILATSSLMSRVYRYCTRLCVRRVPPRYPSRTVSRYDQPLKNYRRSDPRDACSTPGCPHLQWRRHDCFSGTSIPEMISSHRDHVLYDPVSWAKGC